MRWSPQIRRLDWLVARPIAHRGLHDAASGIVENTASAFAAAISKGYTIECDLQLSQDGEAMIFHDDTLDRVTEARGRIDAFTMRELKRTAYQQSADRMQTLGELLDQVGGDVPLLIELKSHWTGDFRLVERVVDVLKTYRGDYALMSFDSDLISWVAYLSPNTVRGIVADRVTDRYYDLLPVTRRLELRWMAHLRRTRPHFISYYWRDLPFEPVGRFRASGRPVICWTIRSPAEASAALRYCDQVTFEGYEA
jgi:glycerophosphoryl diester phosphodiesterase